MANSLENNLHCTNILYLNIEFLRAYLILQLLFNYLHYLLRIHSFKCITIPDLDRISDKKNIYELNIKQETLAYDLGEDWNQKKISSPKLFLFYLILVILTNKR